MSDASHRINRCLNGSGGVFYYTAYAEKVYREEDNKKHTRKCVNKEPQGDHDC